MTILSAVKTKESGYYILDLIQHQGKDYHDDNADLRYFWLSSMIEPIADSLRKEC